MRSRTSARAQITDVAARARVSPATVSRVMNGHASVAADLVERVLSAADELGYRASPVARSLVLGRTQTIAVMVPDMANPSFQEVLRGITRAAAADGYRVLVADSQEDVTQEPGLAREARRHCDALVLCAPRMSDAELAALVPALAPVVLTHRGPTPGVPTSSADYRGGIAALLDHLAGLGHRRLVYLAGPPSSASHRRRLEGIAAHVADHPGLSVDVLPCGVGFEEGYAAGEAVRRSGATAALAFNDLVAMGLLSALHEAGVAVPEEVSVTGFDDIPFARWTTPPLTTAAVPHGDLGQEAWRRLRALLDGEEPPPDVLVHPEVQVRASTGPARAEGAA
ncbi:LacI family DNA-binding transcriptional regulator [Cellulomonas endophytica]|uniref:LacI family DNA-binding transcriptional regulator n=1 Tax=Cellulomonas endophytica TaxID=2494735 RepID=UPI001011BC4A|nr:LacI family DNA-binding transcriptional regulator [Cellulomonas endophytica]